MLALIFFFGTCSAMPKKTSNNHNTKPNGHPKGGNGCTYKGTSDITKEIDDLNSQVAKMDGLVNKLSNSQGEEAKTAAEGGVCSENMQNGSRAFLAGKGNTGNDLKAINALIARIIAELNKFISGSDHSAATAKKVAKTVTDIRGQAKPYNVKIVAAAQKAGSNGTTKPKKPKKS